MQARLAAIDRCTVDSIFWPRVQREREKEWEAEREGDQGRSVRLTPLCHVLFRPLMNHINIPASHAHGASPSRPALTLRLAWGLDPRRDPKEARTRSTPYSALPSTALSLSILNLRTRRLLGVISFASWSIPPRDLVILSTEEMRQRRRSNINIELAINKAPGRPGESTPPFWFLLHLCQTHQRTAPRSSSL